MNYVWTALIVTSFVIAAINGNISETMTAGLAGAGDSVTVLLSFAGIMCFWSGILNICEKSGASAKCEKLLSPIIRRLFPKTKAKPEITLNVISNLFGLGNAATPSGMSAMEKMDKENGENPHPSHEMSRFAVMNTARAAGARGGTIIRSRFMGVEELDGMYESMQEGEKEIIAMVVPTTQRNTIMETINKKHGLKTEAGAVLLSLGIDQIAKLG